MPEATKDEIRFWRDPALGDHGVELLAARCFGHRFKPHFHAEVVIAAFTGGAQLHRVGRREGVAVRGSVLIIPEGEAHTGEAVVRAQGWTYRAFYPDAATLALFASELFVGLHGSLDFGAAPLFADERTGRRLVALHRAVEENPDDPLARQQAFASAMAQVLSSYARPGRAVRRAHEPQAVRRAQDYAQSHYADARLTVDELAAAAGLSSFHFMRSFRSATGITAHTFVTQLRLSRARRLLAEGASAAEVACVAGFADQSHLIRRFRAAFGTTPGRYASASRQRCVRAPAGRREG